MENRGETIEQKIQRLQEQFYLTNPKKIFLKSAQKAKCATHITQHLPLDALMQKSFYIQENTNKLVCDYTIFKTFANPDNYDTIINYIITLANQCIQQYNTYEIHVNLKSFTMTAAQRFSDVIKRFCDKCLHKDSVYSNKMDVLYLHNCPSVIHTIQRLFSGFMDKDSVSKVVLLKESV
jgi:hypothetical protein